MSEAEPELPRAVDLLRGSRGRMWRVIVLVSVIVIVMVVAFVVMRTEHGEVVVRVEGKGCARKPSVVLNGGGDELEVFEHLDVELPWEGRYELHPGDDVMVTAAGDSGCRLTCRILVDGVEKVRRDDVGDVDCQARVE